MILGELSRLCSAILSVSLFSEINTTKIEAPVTLFAFVILISQFLENNMFSIEIDPRREFLSSKGFEKALLLRISLCDRVPLISDRDDHSEDNSGPQCYAIIF